MESRLRAVHILNAVISEHQSLSAVLTKEDTPLTKELCYGTLRWYHQLNDITKQLLHKPLKEKDQDIFILILTALYQLIYMDTPDYAVVNEAVNNAKKLKKNWASGLLNKILRLFIKNKLSILTITDSHPEAYFSHPQWLIDKLKKSWPEHYKAILKANNTRAPMSLRINQRVLERDNYLAHLHKQNTHATSLHSPFGIMLNTPLSVNELPGFLDGYISVQDESGQMVAPLLDLQPGLCVLDACAAPGSKTSHIIELEKSLKKLVAIDIDPNRLNKIKENFTRLNLEHNHVQLVLADVLHTKQWWDGTLFDRILLDAPCSATGVIRRHPDIKVLRKMADISSQAQMQLKILQTCWSLLKPNGKLLYTTCSILPEENEQVIDAFIKSQSDVTVEKIELPIGYKQKYGIQVLPSENGPDGFYYAKLIKNRP